MYRDIFVIHSKRKGRYEEPKITKENNECKIERVMHHRYGFSAVQCTGEAIGSNQYTTYKEIRDPHNRKKFNLNQKLGTSTTWNMENGKASKDTKKYDWTLH